MTVQVGNRAGSHDCRHCFETFAVLYMLPARRTPYRVGLSLVCHFGYFRVWWCVFHVQDDAISYALDHLEERTWAVIALDEAADGRVDYTIRMNFTVVPNTNEVVDMIAIGLDPRFVSDKRLFRSKYAHVDMIQLRCIRT